MGFLAMGLGILRFLTMLVITWILVPRYRHLHLGTRMNIIYLDTCINEILIFMYVSPHCLMVLCGS